MAVKYIPDGTLDNELLMRLKELRTSIAVGKNIPAYYIFPDRTLIAMATIRPTTLDEMEKVYGVGKTKVRQYGYAFLDEITRYLEEDNTDDSDATGSDSAPRRVTSGVSNLQVSVSPVSYTPIEIENFEEIQQQLDYYLSFYKNAAYIPENLQQATADKTNLNRLKKALATKKKEIKDICLEPFRSVEKQLNELISMIDAPLASIAEFTEEMEQVRKDEKCAEIKLFFNQNAEVLGTVADEVFSKPWFYDKKWENKGCKEYQWKSDVRRKINDITRDIQALKQAAGQQTPAVIAKYIDTGSLLDATRYLQTITAIAEREERARQAAVSPAPASAPPATGSASISAPPAAPISTPVSVSAPVSAPATEETTPANVAVERPERSPEYTNPSQNTTAVPSAPYGDSNSRNYLFKVKLNMKQYQLLTNFMELSSIPYEVLNLN